MMPYCPLAVMESRKKREQGEWQKGKFVHDSLFSGQQGRDEH